MPTKCRHLAFLLGMRGKTVNLSEAVQAHVALIFSSREMKEAVLDLVAKGAEAIAWDGESRLCTAKVQNYPSSWHSYGFARFCLLFIPNSCVRLKLRKSPTSGAQ